jgi:prophage antirepressor-like protein
VNPVETFTFNTLPVRLIVEPSGPWWIARDVCEALGLQGDAGQHTRRLDEDEKDLILIQTPGGPQRLAAVNEAGLFALILRSDKPSARSFKRWVTHEVLPSIRRTGAYQVDGNFDIPKTFSGALALAARQAQELETKAVEIAVLEPKAAFHDRVADSDGCHSIQEAAKVLGTGSGRLWAWLREWKYLIPGKTLPYQQYIDNGIFRVVEIAFEDRHKVDRLDTKTLLTGKGMVAIQRRLAAEAPGALIRPQHQPQREV